MEFLITALIRHPWGVSLASQDIFKENHPEYTLFPKPLNRETGPPASSPLPSLEQAAGTQMSL